MMTQEEKDLLLKDLCARLPYGVKCGVLTHPNYRLPNWKKENDLYYKGRPEWQILDARTLSVNPIECFYPYLRPMSSMTEEEEKEMHNYTCVVWDNNIDKHSDEERKTFSQSLKFDWLNAHHFDYRGLIEKSLALEAPEGMYDIMATNI